MTLDDFIARCDALAKRLDITRSALSNRLLFDSRRLDAIAKDGKDIGVRRMETALADLARMEAEADAADAAKAAA